MCEHPSRSTLANLYPLDQMSSRMGTSLLPIQTPSRKELLRAASSLTLISVVAVLCVLVVSILLLRRHRRQVLGVSGTARRKRRPRADPWFESAKRVTRDQITPSPRESEHDTVDLDPVELTPEDVGPGSHDDDEPPDQGWDNDIGPEESRGPQVFGGGPDEPPPPPPRPKHPKGPRPPRQPPNSPPPPP